MGQVIRVGINFMIEDQDRKLGKRIVVLQRVARLKIPRLQAMKRKVDRGELLNQFDMIFLQNLINDCREWQISEVDDKRLQGLIQQLFALYSDVVVRAVENEKAK